MDLLDAAAFHALALSTEGKSPETQEHYLRYERRFLAFLAEQHVPPTLEALNPHHVRRWITWLQQQSTGRRGGEVTVQTAVRVLKLWANFLTREGVYDASPLWRVQKPKITRHERQPFSRTELHALLAVCEGSAGQRPWPARDRLLILLLLDTGIRVGELCSLTLDKLALHKQQASLTVMGKGRKERTIPFGDPARPDGGPTIRALRRYLPERARRARTAHVFISERGFGLSRNAVQELLRRLGQAAGVANVHPHRMRHTFATAYLRTYPGDEWGLRRLMGQVDTRVMADYVHLSQVDMAQRAGHASPASFWLREGGSTPLPRQPASNDYAF
jgi:site-specific recombinase XerD